MHELECKNETTIATNIEREGKENEFVNVWAYGGWCACHSPAAIAKRTYTFDPLQELH